MKYWHWRSYLGFGLANQLKIPSFGCNVTLWLFLQNNGNLDKLMRWVFEVFFGGRVGLLQFGECKGAGRELHLEKTMDLNYVGELAQKCFKEMQ